MRVLSILADDLISSVKRIRVNIDAPEMDYKMSLTSASLLLPPEGLV